VRSIDHRTKPGTPEELVHYGVKGMRWGVRKQEDLVGRIPAKALTPGTPEFQSVVERLTRTDTPQVLRVPAKLPSGPASSPERTEKVDRHGLSKEQKMFLAFGAATAAAAGYVAYQHYVGSKMPIPIGFDPAKLRQEEQALERLGKLPAKWDVSALKHGPISKSNMGELHGGEFEAKLKDVQSLVVNTSRGYADILPKDGFSNPAAAARHASVTRVLEEMRDKYPTVRNLNVEVIPMSRVPGLEKSRAEMCVMAMKAGEARVMYNDLTDLPTPSEIRANAKYLPGLGKKDYVAYHEMGHLLAVAHGELPASFDMLTGNAGPGARAMWGKAEPLLHRRMFAKHGFTFKELSKLSRYGATEPAEAMAELAGHFHHEEMRKKLTESQLQRAEAMFNEMGGLT
jgi:hypothetical protein